MRKKDRERREREKGKERDTERGRSREGGGGNKGEMIYIVKEMYRMNNSMTARDVYSHDHVLCQVAVHDLSG